jgi:hypothetical protein
MHRRFEVRQGKEKRWKKFIDPLLAARELLFERVHCAVRAAASHNLIKHVVN